MSRRFGRQRKRRLKKAMEEELRLAAEAHKMAEGLRAHAQGDRDAWADVLHEVKRELPNWVGLPAELQRVEQLTARFYMPRRQRLEFMEFAGDFPPRPELDLAHETLFLLRAGGFYDHLQSQYRIHLGLIDGKKECFYALSDQGQLPASALEYVSGMVSEALIRTWQEQQ
jgi:hypothetical protein